MSAPTRVIAAIYRMDFDIEDEDARERVVKHVAERALAPMIPGSSRAGSDTD